MSQHVASVTQLVLTCRHIPPRKLQQIEYLTRKLVMNYFAWAEGNLHVKRST